MQETVLVTGGAGFIGSHISEELVGSGYRVIVLDDLSGGFESNVPKGATFVKGSITDYALLENLFQRYGFAYVFHAAAYASVGMSHFVKRLNYENNVMGSVNLINLSVNHNVKCFVFTSSISVYGENQLPMSEDAVPRPEDPYGISKYAIELELESTRRMFGLNYIIFRLHNVYGERQNIQDRYRNVIGIFMNQIMNKKSLTVFGDGEQTRAYTYVKDVSSIIAKSIRLSVAFNNVFNVGSDETCSINRLIKIIASEFGVKPQIDYQPARNEVKHAFCSHEKMKNFFDYQSRYTLEEGIRSMADWARREIGGQKTNFESIEIMKNLPEVWKSEQ
jgi:UDP-glucose 4-epimerase